MYSVSIGRVLRKIMYGTLTINMLYNLSVDLLRQIEVYDFVSDGLHETEWRAS